MTGPNGKTAAKRRERQLAAADILERALPYDADAEIAVIGSVLLAPDCLDDLAAILTAKEFFDDASGKLFACMTSMHDQGRKLDPKLITNKLKAEGTFEQVGGAAYLCKAAESVPNAAHAVYYAQIVRDTATLRCLIEGATAILRDAYDPGQETPAALLARAEATIFEVAERQTVSTIEAASIKTVLHQALDRIDKRARGETDEFIPTGLATLDQIIDGTRKGELTILAARPSQGKTALALSILENVSITDRAATLFISLEMSELELADRLLCSRARVSSKRLRNGTMTALETSRVIEAAAVISSGRIRLDSPADITVPQIAALARRTKRRDGLDLLIVDYLQLVSPINQRDPRQEQVAKNSRMLKSLSRELEIPILCLCQLNREVDKGGKPRPPRLSDLRESGAIEQDADVVTFIYRPDKDEQVQGDAAEPCQLIVAKQRNGPVGIADCLFFRRFATFESPAPARFDEFEIDY